MRVRIWSEITSAFQCHRLARWIFTLPATNRPDPKTHLFLVAGDGDAVAGYEEKEVVKGRIGCSEKREPPPGKPVASQIQDGENHEFLASQFTIRVPGLAQDVAEAIARSANLICPYSGAVHGSIDVALNVITA